MASRYAATDSKKLQKARERYKLANETDTQQAEREREDLAFYAGEQWDVDMAKARLAMPASKGMPAVPARPTLVINKVREPIRQVQNEIRDSDIGIELTPADDFGDLGILPDDTEVMVREGLVRRIQRESDAQEARNWAGDRADIAGRGYYLVMTRYLPGKTMDQEVYLERIYNQAGVKIDPARTQPDGSDADWGFIGTWMPVDRYQADYATLADGSKNPFTESGDADFIGLTEAYPDWYQAEGEHRAIRVVDYYYTERQSRTLHQLEDGRMFWAEEMPEGVKPVFSRTVVQKTMKFCKIGGGIHELEETDLASPEMPIIEVLGEELHPFDEQRRVEGMIRPARDSQMGFNYMASKQVEVVGLTPIPALHVDPEAIDGYEAWYAVANTRTLPYLPSRTYDDHGRPLKEPHRPAVDPNILPIAQSLAMFDMAIKSTTAVPDPTLGNVDASLKSGRAIRETVANAKASTSNFLSNRIRSMRREAFVINSYLYAIYGAKPGRLVRTLTGEGKPEMVQIGDRAEQQQQQAQRKAVKVAKLTKDANFNIAIKITKNFDTRRQQESSELGELIGAQPEFMTWFGDLYLQNGDTPNRKQLAKRAKVMLAPPIQAMLQQEESGEEIPAAAQQQIAQLTQRLQEAEQVMQGQNQALQTKQIEQQGKVQIEQMTLQAKVELEKVGMQRDLALEQVRQQTELETVRQNNATRMYIAELQAKTQGVLQAAEAEHEMVASAHAQSHEAEQRDLDRENETRVAAHNAAMADGQQDRSEAEAERGRQATAEQAEADRKAQPKNGASA